MKAKNPWKKVLNNAKSAQTGWNAKHQRVGINRPVKTFSCTPEDLERIFEEQGRKSKWLGVPINPDDVFRKHFPLSPSLDRLDNSKDYTPDNICISTRFENWGFNKVDDATKDECISVLKNYLKNV